MLLDIEIVHVTTSKDNIPKLGPIFAALVVKFDSMDTNVHNLLSILVQNSIVTPLWQAANSEVEWFMETYGVSRPTYWNQQISFYGSTLFWFFFFFFFFIELDICLFTIHFPWIGTSCKKFTFSLMFAPKLFHQKTLLLNG